MTVSSDSQNHKRDIPRVCAAELLRIGQRSDDTAAYLNQALPLIREAVGADGLAVFVAQSGHWQSVASLGVVQPAPTELLADVLDRENMISAGAWLATPMIGSRNREVLALHRGAKQFGASQQELAVALAGVLAEGLDCVRQRQRMQNRLARLEAMLEIAERWNRIQEMEPLLVEIAEAACRLLKADRASIFLWDRHTHSLVGKPALGVKRGELRIPDNTGVVGQVVTTGEPRRVNEFAAHEIDRKVDQQLGYETKSLLCVPLVGRNKQRFGAFEMVNKLGGDFTEHDEEALTELAAHAAVALENARDREALIRSQRQIVDQAASNVELIGESAPIAALRSALARVADTDLAILILGENGTGKEVVARSIHYQSRRRNQPFIAVNCAAITETLLESELFGHEKGAFTDAREARPGKFEVASGGTLFLDEIGELSPAGQAKLLRVLEEKIVVRVGGSLPIHTDVRVLAATNRDLAEMVRARQFREDLFFRLNVVSIELPPLCKRGRDVLLLAEHFLEQFARRIGRTTPRFSEAAQAKLMAHPWPGNVRELRNLMERLAYLSPADEIDANDLAFILAPLHSTSGPALVPPGLSLAEATDRFQNEYIQQAISQAGGNMSEAAEHLGLHRSNLYRKMRQLGMHAE